MCFWLFSQASSESGYISNSEYTVSSILSSVSWGSTSLVRQSGDPAYYRRANPQGLWCLLGDGPCAVLCLIAKPCLTLYDPMNCSPPGSSVHGVSPGKNTRVGCHALLQGIFSSQGLNPDLPYCRLILYCLSNQSQWVPLANLSNNHRIQ